MKRIFVIICSFYCAFTLAAEEYIAPIHYKYVKKHVTVSPDSSLRIESNMLTTINTDSGLKLFRSNGFKLGSDKEPNKIEILESEVLDNSGVFKDEYNS